MRTGHVIVMGILALVAVLFVSIGSIANKADKKQKQETKAKVAIANQLAQLPKVIHLQRCSGSPSSWTHITKVPGAQFFYNANKRQVRLQFRDLDGQWRDYVTSGFASLNYRICARKPNNSYRDEDLHNKYLSLRWSMVHPNVQKRSEQIFKFQAALPKTIERLNRCGKPGGWAYIKIPQQAILSSVRPGGPILIQYQDEFGVWLEVKPRFLSSVTAKEIRVCALYPMESRLIKISDAYGKPVYLKWKQR